MHIIVGIIFIIGLIGYAFDLYKGIRLFNDLTPLPDRDDIKWTYLAFGLMGISICLIVITTAFFGEVTISK